MIEGLHPYEACKDTGVPWLGEMLEHWVPRRTKVVLGNEVRRDSLTNLGLPQRRLKESYAASQASS
jgi:hypothetical protein